MIKEYIKYLTYTKNYSENTIQAYEIALVQFVRTMSFSQKRWSTITPDDVQGYLADLLANGKSSSTIIQHISAIRGIFRWMQLTYALPNPTIYIQSPKKMQTIPHIVNMSDVRKAIIAESDTMIRIGIALMAFVGLRTSEVLNMNYEDIDTTTGRILVIGKGRKERYVYIPTSVLYYIPKRPGSVITYSDREFRYLVWFAFNRIGVHCSPHMLRHTFASAAIDKGMRLDILREILGHTSLSTTQIYLHIRPNIVKQECEKCNVIN